MEMSDNCDEIMVSVIVLSYNHEEYIAQALDSIVNQIVNFKYEVLVGDDRSNDKTQDIIAEYSKKYSDVIVPVLRQENLGGKHNMYDLMMRCQGRYVAFLEGDDCWTDNNKLQKQVDFLEKNREYIGCAHRFNVIDRYGNVYFDRDFQIQFIEGNEYTIKDFEKGKLVSHLNSLVYRNIYREKEKDFFSFWLKFDNMAGDAVINLILALMGKIYCMEEIMSSYRKVIDKGSSSFSAMQEQLNKRDKLFYSQIQLENLIYKKFNKKISFKKRKKNIFASAVFKWNRDRNEKNKKVVDNIMEYSGHPFVYRVFKTYLLAMKKIMLLVFKEDRRVPF